MGFFSFCCRYTGRTDDPYIFKAPSLLLYKVAYCTCRLFSPRLPFRGVCGSEKWGGCDLGSLLWLLLSSVRGTCVTREPLSIKHYILWNGLVNRVQLLNMFYIFICLL